MKFQRYKRGALVMADFSPSKGSELKGKHLAIVITKNDSPNNAVLTVIPLSSKEKPYYLNLGNFLWKVVQPEFQKRIDHTWANLISLNEKALHTNKELLKIEALNNIDEKELLISEVSENLNEIESLKKTLSKNITEFESTIKIYSKMNVNSFALVQNITTISKLRLLKPINYYDPILNLKVSDEILNKIDKKIIDLFTAYSVDN